MPTYTYNVSSGESKNVQGTNAVDIVKPLRITVVPSRAALAADMIVDSINLNQISIKKVNANEIKLSVYNDINSTNVVTLRNFNPAVDKISTAQGDFTLQEIFDHGSDAPFYKQARINCQLQRNCK